MYATQRSGSSAVVLQTLSGAVSHFYSDVDASASSNHRFYRLAPRMNEGGVVDVALRRGEHVRRWRSQPTTAVVSYLFRNVLDVLLLFMFAGAALYSCCGHTLGVRPSHRAQQSHSVSSKLQLRRCYLYLQRLRGAGSCLWMSQLSAGPVCLFGALLLFLQKYHFLSFFLSFTCSTSAVILFFYDKWWKNACQTHAVFFLLRRKTPPNHGLAVLHLLREE